MQRWLVHLFRCVPPFNLGTSPTVHLNTCVDTRATRQHFLAGSNARKVYVEIRDIFLHARCKMRRLYKLSALLPTVAQPFAAALAPCLLAYRGKRARRTS